MCCSDSTGSMSDHELLWLEYLPVANGHLQVSMLGIVVLGTGPGVFLQCFVRVRFILISSHGAVFERFFSTAPPTPEVPQHPQLRFAPPAAPALVQPPVVAPLMKSCHGPPIAAPSQPPNARAPRAGLMHCHASFNLYNQFISVHNVCECFAMLLGRSRGQDLDVQLSSSSSAACGSSKDGAAARHTLHSSQAADDQNKGVLLWTFQGSGVHA